MSFQKFNQLAEQITEEIIAGLEQGRVMWQKPWTAYGMPMNAGTKRAYEGFNALYLNHVTLEKAYKTPYFVTFKQALELGGNVIKGQKGYPVTFWKIYKKENPATAIEKTKFVPFHWTVFNIDQVEGVAWELPEFKERTPLDVIDACQQVYANYPEPKPRLEHGGGQAYYMSSRDLVQMPEMDTFERSEYYYSVLFHELVHSTGHEIRLKREMGGGFGSDKYSKEELVAEIGASFLNGMCGILEPVFDNSVAYLQGWAGKLREDKSLIITASTAAFKAASFILQLKAVEAQEKEAA